MGSANLMTVKFRQHYRSAGRRAAFSCLKSALRATVVTAAAILTLAIAVNAQGKFDKHRINEILVKLDGGGPSSTTESFKQMVAESIGTTYSAGKIRDSIQALYDTKKIASVLVSASLDGSGGVVLQYVIKRKPEVEKLIINIGKDVGDEITEQDLRFKLNLLAPGTVFTQQVLQDNADQILDYLRTRGFYRSEVTFELKPSPQDNAASVIFNVTPNEQSTVEKFDIDIQGLSSAVPSDQLSLAPGEFYSRAALEKDIAKIRSILQKQDFAAPELDEPRVNYDTDKNKITISLSGKVGPSVKVSAEDGRSELGDSVLDRLVPIKREGTLDFSAIVEGERRLENYFQERGYFFADVTPICSVTPPVSDGESAPVPNNTSAACATLGGADLNGRSVTVDYQVAKNRKLKLVSVRIRGTGLLPIEEIRPVLETQQANFLGVIPLFGYGNGYTSLSILDRDESTIRSLMNELGYRSAEVHVNQGVTPDGESLIITFEVEPGPPTVVGSVDIVGNKAIDTSELRARLPSLVGENFSRARARSAVKALREFYSDRGYFDARVTFSVAQPTGQPSAENVPVKLEFHIDNEGQRVLVNRVLATGNENTRPSAIIKASTFKGGDFLRASDIYLSEQNLYGTDSFDRVDIKTEPAGTKASGEKLADVIINVNEQKPRLLTYGGGYSTDLGLSGFFDIRHVNLFGNLWQAGARVRWSQRQQLAQLDLIIPRFLRDGDRKFTPLTLSAQYQRDSTVTRFFRSAFDKGTFGIVQRLDSNGNPIDQFGAKAGSPTINRLSISAETSRTLSRKYRSIVFVKYRFEDVRLANVGSLLIKDLLAPDAHVRIAGPTVTFVRDTRENCSKKFSLLDRIATGEKDQGCRYNASDPTRGDYLTLEYGVSVPQLGANTGFHKFQASYNLYYTFPGVRNTTLAARAVLGLATVFSPANKVQNAQFPDLNGVLPISERFFAGGSTTLRGFDIEEAGPRVVVVPQGIFLDSDRKPVNIPPFTIPFGGNALAIVNLEARIPLSATVRAVTFYDGGNVFRRVEEIFNPPNVPVADVFRQNLRALWTHTTGVGLRIKTPVGGEFAVDYGYLLNPPRFLIPQPSGPNAIYQLKQGHFHFRFSQAF